MYKQVLQNQYNKCLNILSEAIKNYSEDLWYDNKNYKSPAWQIAYHGLFFANIYCSATESGIKSWPKSKDDYHFFHNKPWPPFEEIIINEPYTKDEMLEFLEFVKSNIPEYLLDMQPEERCWPHWYDENQLEFHINNIRHIQHHIAEIIERHDIVSSFKYDWQ